VNKFTIEYYCERFHTGDLNYNKIRTGVVFANGREDAISKVRLADNNYIGIKNMTFEEIMQGGDS
jgi:hypothetical protein